MGMGKYEDKAYQKAPRNIQQAYEKRVEANAQHWLGSQPLISPEIQREFDRQLAQVWRKLVEGHFNQPLVISKQEFDKFEEKFISPVKPTNDETQKAVNQLMGKLFPVEMSAPKPPSQADFFDYDPSKPIDFKLLRY